MPTCKACGAPLVWAETRPPDGTGQEPRRMPLDAEPHPAGNVVFNVDGKVQVLGARAALEARDAGRTLYKFTSRISPLAQR